ncbi:hypothetical protein AKO1_002614 [Acrasis kona]|uniref:Uncharacterized protein n=1 Tax=Acrasis kona TaxID=1008807 RepID=A0AAW2ZQN2_9EUKA
MVSFSSIPEDVWQDKNKRRRRYGYIPQPLPRRNNSECEAILFVFMMLNLNELTNELLYAVFDEDFLCHVRHHKNFILFNLMLGLKLSTEHKNILLRVACKFGDLSLAEKLLGDDCVDSTSGQNLPLRYACRFGNDKIVRLLLACPRVNPRAADNQSIRFAVKYGHKHVLELLLKDGRAEPSKLLYTTFRYLIHTCDTHGDIVEMLIKDGHPHCHELYQQEFSRIKEYEQKGIVFNKAYKKYFF